MNIKVQLCGLVVVMFLFAISRTHKKIGTDSEKSFSYMIIISISSIILDILSVVAIYFRGSLPLVLVDAVCKTYLVSMIWVGWIYFCYVMLGINSNYVWHNRSTTIMTIVTFIEMIVVFLLPIKIFAEGEIVYTYDLAVTFTYVFTIFYIISSLVVSAYILVKQKSRRGMAMLMTTIVWLIAGAVQSYFNELLLVSFANASGIMIVFTVIDNPDRYLDKDLGCFNAYGFSTYIHTKFYRNEDFAVLDVSVLDVKALEDKGIDVKKATKKLISLLDLNREIRIFKNLNAGFLVVANNPDKLTPIIDLVSKYISKIPGASQSVCAFLINDGKQFGNLEELTRVLTYIRTKNQSSESLITYNSDAIIKRYRENKLIEEEIKKAIAEDRIEVFLQPIHSINDETTKSCEALVRIRNLDGTLMSPAKFIPVAEETGLVKDVGEIVLDKVCKFLKTSEAIKLGIEKVHVNLSAIQCDDNLTAAKLISIVEKNGIETKYINFEITETAVSSNKEALLENMNALISKGFSFSLDDFGKGESNLMYIVDLPVDELKIDIDLSKAFFINSKAKIVVRAISSMAKMLGVPLVAEGIENEYEFTGMKKEGVTDIQGYFFSKPLPMDEFIEYLSDSEKRNEVAKKIEQIDEQADSYFAKIKIHGNKVLLVEDNELNAMIETEVLTAAGFDVEVATDGVYALEIMSQLDSKKYDVVLMDISMPIMDGFETTRRIRSLKNKFCANIPIIALSAMNMDELMSKALKVGMSNQLNKPFSIQDLKNIIDF